MAAKHTASVDNLLRASTSSSLATVNGFDCNAEAAVAPRTSKSSESNKLGPWLKSKWKRVVEIVVLSSIILFVCGLFTIPTIIYALPPLQSDEEPSINSSHLCLDDLEDAYDDNTTLCLNTTVKEPVGDILCAQGFYLDNSSHPACIPLCKSWLSATAADIAFAISLVVAIISGIILLVIVRLQKDILMVFPTYYLVYVCFAVLFAAPFLIVGAVLKAEVYCSSDSFIESMTNSSPFCTVSGVVNVYTVVQIALLVTFHALGLCWSVTFPFHYRKFKAYERIKYIHASTVVLSLVLPAIPALLHLIDGYSILSGPLDACIVRNIATSYFTLTLPLSVVMAMATSALVILFWKLFKEFVLKQFHIQRPKSHVTKAEIKIFIIMCYYVVMGILTLSTYTYYLATDDETLEAYQSYFTCQSVGIRSDRDCGDVPNIRLQEFNAVASVALFLQGLLPLMILTFIVSCSCCSKNQLSRTLSKSKSNAASEQPGISMS